MWKFLIDGDDNCLSFKPKSQEESMDSDRKQKTIFIEPTFWHYLSHHQDCKTDWFPIGLQ